MHDQPTLSRRRFVRTALGAVGAGALGAGLLRGGAASGQTADPVLDGMPTAAAASETASRLRLVQKGAIAFPVLNDVPLTVFDNFGGNSQANGQGAHKGVDIWRTDGRPGQPLLACVDGVLVGQRIDVWPMGNAWVLEDVNGDIYRYHHLESFADGLQEGDRVQVGDVLGTMGSSGNPLASAPHLHFEVRRGGSAGPAEDPLPLFPLPMANVCVSGTAC